VQLNLGAELFWLRKEVSKLSKGSKTFSIGRNAKTGRLTSVEKAREKPATHVVEKMPKAGHGDTKSGKK
jgi:hypothetical protein